MRGCLNFEHGGKRVKIIFTITILLAISFSASAEECSDVRLDQTIMSQIPTEDQGDTNLCFAYSATQLIDTYFLSQNPSGSFQKTSSLDLATRTIQTKETSTIYGGWIKDSLETAREEGLSLPPENFFSRSDVGGAVLKENLLKALSEQKPVAVNFCSEVVQRRNFSPGYGGFGMCARHYAVVVGRKEIDGQCHVLVRDSQCGKYKNKEGHPVCENGQYWINIIHLINNTDGVTWL